MGTALVNREMVGSNVNSFFPPIKIKITLLNIFCLAFDCSRAHQCPCQGPTAVSTWEAEVNLRTGEIEME